MSSVISSFNYKVEASVIIDNTDYKIPDGTINSIIVDYDYDRKNMPAIYVALRLTTDLYNKMVTNAETGIISFRLYKFNTQLQNSIISPYIQDSFTYIISGDPNYNEAMEKYAGSSGSSDTDSNSYMQGHIGLVSLSLSEKNNILINDVVKNTNLASIIHRYTHHMKMCIEPFDNIDTIDQFIIPPINTITNFLAYMNENFCFYKSGYRFFRDFSTSYLLSMKGKPVETSDTDYNSIVIYVCDPTDEKANTTAIEFDTTNKAYVIYVNANNVTTKPNRVLSKKFNSIIGVDTLGNINELELDLPTYADATKKNIFERVPNDNMELINNTKSSLESGSLVVSVIKNEIDTSILTPNKQYFIKSHNLVRKYDGRYILCSKKEIFYRTTSSFVCTVSFNLRKAED